jgi:tetratricopeptide (TPR) repeat protein
MLATTALRSVLLGLVLAATAGAALADAAQDCKDATLTAEERKTACAAAATEAESYEELAFTHLHADQPEEALPAARRAVEIATYITLDSPEEAQAAAGRMVNLGPEYEDTQGLFLQALAETGAVDEAMAGYQEARAAGVEDTSGFIAHNLSWGLYKAGEHDKALPIIEEWLAAHPGPRAIPNTT